jgi:dGTPase
MEAADDISYLTADLEDSVEKGILSLDEVYNIITSECTKQNEEFFLTFSKKSKNQILHSTNPFVKGF